MTVAVIVAVVAVAVLVIAVAVLRPRRGDDDIDDFRRQIDALSKESRRPTIDRMNPSEPGSADEDGGDEPEATT